MPEDQGVMHRLRGFAEENLPLITLAGVTVAVIGFLRGGGRRGR